MQSHAHHFCTAFFALCGMLAALLLLPVLALAQATDPLPSWNEGPAKTAIIEFMKATTDTASPKFVPPEARTATFDQDGTTWVEQPMYTQVMYCLDRVPALAEKKPELKSIEPFKTVLSSDREAWIETAKHPRFNRLYTELTYKPMLEVMRLFRDNGYKTYFVTGGGQDFVRVYSQQVYGVPVEQVVGSAGATQFGYDKDGKPVLIKIPKLLLNDDKAGKPEGIHFAIGRRPVAAFGNSIGDKEMLEYTQAGDGAQFMLLVHHDDAEREYAYGPSEYLLTPSWTRPRAKAGSLSA